MIRNCRKSFGGSASSYLNNNSSIAYLSGTTSLFGDVADEMAGESDMYLINYFFLKELATVIVPSGLVRDRTRTFSLNSYFHTTSIC